MARRGLPRPLPSGRPVLTPAERDALITRYADGPSVVAAAVADADGRLDRRRDAGSWSAREVVHHLADSEMTSAIRLRRLLCETEPTIAGYDEKEFARRLHYTTRDVGPSLDALSAARRSTADILGLLGPEDWARAGTHTETGPYSVDDWLVTYAAHAHDHAEQIREAAGSTG